MRVVTLQELGDCPRGTIFSDYEPCIVKELYRFQAPLRRVHEDDEHHKKGMVTDFFYQSIMPEPGDDAYCEPGDDPTKGFKISGNGGRWGCFEYDALFLVYDKEDVARLVTMLTGTEADIEKMR